MINGNKFRAGAGMGNRHLQTLLPTAWCRKSAVPFQTSTLELPDGDFIDLSWTRVPVNTSSTPIVVIFHGLEGSARSPYAQQMMREVAANGWIGVVMHFRGCSGRLNRLARSYHSGDTADAEFFIQQLRRQYPSSPLYGVGFSLGGNMLLKLAGTKQADLGLQAIVGVSVPLRLDRCADQLRQGFSRVYQQHLLSSLKKKVLDKFSAHDYQSLIGLNRSQLQACVDFWQFDDAYTAPVHGFDGAEDYYATSSAIHYLPHIKKPALIIHAKDDPFMPTSALPEQIPLSPSTLFELSDKGGHVGFVSGKFWRPRFWLPERIIAFFKDN